jgi:GT2 family glycosyltransferase
MHTSAHTTHIAIVIPLYNGAPYIGACLDALAAQTRAPARVLVVDDASSDDGAAIAGSRPGVQVIRQRVNFGYAHSINAGLAALRDAPATGFTLLLNQDTVLDPGCLAALHEAFAADSALGIAGCKIFYPDRKTLQHAGGFLDRPSATAHHYGQHEVDAGQHDQPTAPDFVTGAALALTHKARAALGGMDETISRAYFEDIDLCFRARAAGFGVRYVPAATLSHLESSVIPKNSYVQALHYETGRMRFVLRHWPADQLEAFVAHERASFGPVRTLDSTLASARAYGRALFAFNDCIASRRRIHGRAFDPDGRPDFWPFMQQALLSLHDAAMQHALSLVQGAVDTPAAPGHWDAHSSPAPSPRLQEFTFTSSVPVIGGLIAWARNAVHGFASRWALRYVTDQQAAINAHVLRALELNHLRILELALENRDLVERLSILQRERPADAGEA